MHFPYAPELLKSIQDSTTGRKMASVPDLSAEEEKSSRRVYFSTLYHQYLILGPHLGKKSDLDFCPQFHHDKIETDALGVPEITFYKASSVDDEGRAFFPELAFGRKFSLKDYHAEIGE